MSLNFYTIKQYYIISCSIALNWTVPVPPYLFEFNEDGPVYGPNGLWELDPDNQLCLNDSMQIFASFWARPVFASCKNNCPGGKLFCNN